jgi:iron complex outermembrane receptor protein
MPDFASSTENIQIQRGVGTSSNGSAAFGASINLQTSSFDSTGYVELNNTYGSFNTRRHNAIFNSGLLNDHFQFEGRLSYIASDGYIDRSAADLRSYYVAGGYYGDRLMIKGLTFAGREVTQQAWYGTPESRLYGTEDDRLTHAINNGYTDEQTANLLNSGRTYNHYTYDNEIDNYGQDHYQLITGYALSDKLYLNVTGHYTYGRGYFEQFRGQDDLADFGLAYPVIGGDTITSGDVIVRRWLDNHFYGGVFSLQYKGGAHRLTWGGSANEYQGDHFGEVIWSQFAPEAEIRDRYYESTSRKQDASSYLKWEYDLRGLTFFADMQGRFIDYKAQGVDNDQRPIDVDVNYLFFNPKAGLSARIGSQYRVYASVARASREPVRNDFIDAAPGVVPSPEYLTDVESGVEFRSERLTAMVNAYYMHYTDQLVLTGEVNDVGAPVRTNVPESYRAGVEASVKWMITDQLTWQPNATFSQNKITAFTELIYDYTEGFDVVEVQHQNTDIAFSPSLIAGSQLSYAFDWGLELAWLTKYVGRQYLDNTGNVNRSIDPYLVNDARITYQPKVKGLKRVELNLLVNNVLNEMYAANGYTFSYIFGQQITENFYYPQATRNFLAGLTLRF